MVGAEREQAHGGKRARICAIESSTEPLSTTSVCSAGYVLRCTASRRDRVRAAVPIENDGEHAGSDGASGTGEITAAAPARRHPPKAALRSARADHPASVGGCGVRTARPCQTGMDREQRGQRLRDGVAGRQPPRLANQVRRLDGIEA
jgi:hypothetical protein